MGNNRYFPRRGVVAIGEVGVVLVSQGKREHLAPMACKDVVDCNNVPTDRKLIAYASSTNGVIQSSHRRRMAPMTHWQIAGLSCTFGLKCREAMLLRIKHPAIDLA